MAFLHYPKGIVVSCQVEMKIAIDAGHGGNDPGAVGARLKEKDVNLKLALGLEEVLEEDYEVILTRSGDAFLHLRERSDLANNKNADIFISIHCNGFHKESANGIETFHFPGSVQGELLAKSIHSSMQPTSGMRERGIKAAKFSVLARTKMPAVLLEIGFITNPEDESKMANEKWIERMALAIREGVDDYFAQRI